MNHKLVQPQKFLSRNAMFILSCISKYRFPLPMYDLPCISYTGNEVS